MLKLTLDNNCILNLENNREPMASAVKALLSLHQAGSIRLRVICVTGFERPQGGTDRIPYIEEFRALIRNVGLGEVDVLPCIFYFDTAFRFDSGFIFGDGADFALEQEIHRTLFPTDGDGTWEGFMAAHADWDDKQRERNWKKHKQDSLTMWGHIHHKGDVFVTSDRRDFLRKVDPLIALGARAVLSPEDALRYVQASMETE